MIPAAVGVVLVLAATIALARHDHDGDYDWPRIRRTQLLMWLFATAVVAYVLFVERRPLTSLDPGAGTSIDLMTVGWAWILVAGTAVVVALAVRLVGRQQYDPVVETLVGLPIHRALFVSVSAGVAEEIIYRGFLLTRLASLTGSERVAVVVGGLAFAAMHAASRNRTRLVQLAALGVAFGVAFFSTDSLLAVVVVHASYDALVLGTTDSENLQKLDPAQS